MILVLTAAQDQEYRPVAGSRLMTGSDVGTPNHNRYRVPRNAGQQGENLAVEMALHDLCFGPP